ncbi:MAG: hypothetical protein JNN01_13155 [Opitutaceae bacterium]|nr:hypothetical protein [Opitutaceae bacterium]
MKKFLLAPFLAALAMFFWGFIYYGLSGIPYKSLASVGDVGPELNKLFPADGTYVLPDPRGTPDVIAEQMKRGQFAMVHIKKSGVPEMDPSVMAKGFALEFISCLLLAFMVHKAASSFQGFGGRVMFSVTIGVLLTLFSNGGQAIWWHQDWGWHIMTMVHDVVAYLLAGIVVALFHTPKSA